MAKDNKKADKKATKTKSAPVNAKDNKRNFFKSAAKFFRECKTEIKKVVWPAPRTVFKNMGVVLVVIIIIGLFIFGLDTAFINLLGLFMSVSK